MLRLKETKKVYVLEGNYSKVWVEFYDDDPETCYITHLYVEPKARRKGEGNFLSFNSYIDNCNNVGLWEKHTIVQVKWLRDWLVS